MLRVNSPFKPAEEHLTAETVRRIAHEEIKAELDKRDYVTRTELKMEFRKFKKELWDELDVRLRKEFDRQYFRILAVLKGIDTKPEVDEKVQKQTKPLSRRLQNHEARISQLEVNALPA